MVSYVDKIIHHQMVRGLYNPVIQEKVLSMGKRWDTFEETMSNIEALEMAMRDRATLAWPGRLHRQGGGFGKSDGAKKDERKIKCWGCGKNGHHKWSDQCPVKDRECFICKQKGNFQAHCIPKKDGKVSEVAEPRVEEANGNLGLMSPCSETVVGSSPPL